MDILYTVYTDGSNHQFFRRLQCSIESLLRTNFDVKICIVDASPVPIKYHLSLYCNFKYLHYKNKFTTFNKSHAINVGVKNLVKSEIFKLSDADIVYPHDHIFKVNNEMKTTDYLTYHGYFIHTEFYASEFSKLLTLPGHWSNTPGIPTLTKELFYKLRGYDESYLFKGYEDADFEYRAGLVSKKYKPFHDDFQVAHLWHPANLWNIPEKEVENKEKFRILKRAYNHREKDPMNVNPDGWGEM